MSVIQLARCRGLFAQTLRGLSLTQHCSVSRRPKVTKKTWKQDFKSAPAKAVELKDVSFSNITAPEDVSSGSDHVLTERLSLAHSKANSDYFSSLASAVQTAAPVSEPFENNTLNQQNISDVTEISKNLHKSGSGCNNDISSFSDNEIATSIVNVLPIKPALPKTSFNLAAYVNESSTLSNLVKLGVDLSKLEQDVDVANYLVKADFDADIRPYVSFLHDNGVQDSDIGQCVTHSPSLLRQSLDDLQVRVNYFESKHFTKEAVARIITKAPELLSTPVMKTDAQLGFLQRLFLLTGEEVRTVITRYPKIAVWNKTSIELMKITFKDMGFTEPQLKTLLLTLPKLYMSGRHAVMKRFNYLHDVVGYSHEDILGWPLVLRTRQFIVQQRYSFIRLIGRDQFDPKKENYVSLKLLVLGRDSEFCENVAKVPVKQYNDFLKTL